MGLREVDVQGHREENEGLSGAWTRASHSKDRLKSISLWPELELLCWLVGLWDFGFFFLLPARTSSIRHKFLNAQFIVRDWAKSNRRKKIQYRTISGFSSKFLDLNTLGPCTASFEVLCLPFWSIKSEKLQKSLERQEQPVQLAGRESVGWKLVRSTSLRLWGAEVQGGMGESTYDGPLLPCESRACRMASNSVICWPVPLKFWN